MYVFCNRSAHSSPPPHTAVPQSAHSVINAICSMALINRTLLTFYTWPARYLKLPHMPPPLSLSFPLFLCFPLFSIFFLGFRHLIFSSSSQSFYTSGFQAFIVLISPFEIDWLKSQLEVAASAIGFSVLYLLLHSSRSIAAFNGASACVNIVCFPLITCP